MQSFIDLNSAWFHAADSGDLSQLEQLHSSIPSLDIFNEEGLTALMICCALGYASCVEFLLNQGADPLLVSKDHDQWNALFYSCYENHIECSRLLLRRSFDINYQDFEGYTALMRLSLNPFDEAHFNLLLSYSPDLTITNPGGFNIFSRACYFKVPLILDFLPNDSSFMTAARLSSLLIAASKRRFYDGARKILLQEKRLQLNFKNEKDSMGFNALSYAIIDGDRDMVLLLLEHGVSLKIQCCDNLLPKELAIDCEKFELYHLLCSYEEQTFFDQWFPSSLHQLNSSELLSKRL